MPASIAHMLIFEDALSLIETEKGYDDLLKIMKENIEFGRLGAVGPDLPYFKEFTRASLLSIYFMFVSDKPAGIEQWSSQLHSKDPNIFPLKMIEIAWRETDIKSEDWDDISKKQWAFTMGFLSHLAADQIIHPYVNSIAGQYYRNKENTVKHRKCEMYHDVVLFKKKRNKNVSDENMLAWIDVSRKSESVESFFRVFLQKAFIESHAIYPSEKDISEWVTGFYILMKGAGLFYKAEIKDYSANGENSDNYKQYWLNNGGKPYEEYYKEAVELVSIYIKTAYQLYRINHTDFEDKHREYFLKVVRNADLTNPLDKNILGDARKEYANAEKELWDTIK